MRCSGLAGVLRNTVPSRRQMAVSSPPGPDTRPPPSIGHALSVHEPTPSRAAGPNVRPSVERATYISRFPSTLLRNIRLMSPAAPIAIDGWQHSHTDPDGDV